jgi:hypothetical protein
MDNDKIIVERLTEIRDNQLKQMEWSKGALAKQQRRAVIAAIVFGLGVTLLIIALRH